MPKPKNKEEKVDLKDQPLSLELLKRLDCDAAFDCKLSEDVDYDTLEEAKAQVISHLDFVLTDFVRGRGERSEIVERVHKEIDRCYQRCIELSDALISLMNNELYRPGKPVVKRPPDWTM